MAAFLIPNYSKTIKNKFILTEDFIFFVEDLKHIKFKNEYIDIWNGVIVIKKGFIWNGCTFALNTKKTMVASLIHDALYQIKVIDRNKCDKIFYKILKLYDFEFSLLYFLGVKIFGWIFY